MLYPQSKKERLEDTLFQNPDSEYRGAPFWAWNSSLEEEQLKEQIEYFKEMGFGGFHMHVRQGLETEYLANDFMDAVKVCVEKAKKEGMYAWLYDEDRWPSGCAGGKVTADIRYRIRYLLMTKQRMEDCADCYEEAYNEGKPLLLGVFRICVSKQGIVTEYKKLAENEAECYAAKETAGSDIRFFYCMTRMEREPRYNYQTYSDNMSKEAVDTFIRKTHEVYKEEIGNDFGNTVPAIFTDEPQMKRAVRLQNAFSEEDAVLAFTLDFPDTFQRENGYDLRDRLPELFFACSDSRAKKTRYDYYRHTSNRFHAAYADNIGTWCQRNGIMLTGHAMGEDCLEDMTCNAYETMRLYKEMELPGIDMLFDDRAFTTAIQCRSAVRQYGREGMMSELYGVTGWDFDFRGHKFQGDWQACMGVTVRVPHLAWQSMKGEGKRDYPASIFYQSPWYKEYKYLEDHYARIHTALTRGKAVARVGVLHPIESYWMERASDAETLPLCRELDERFHQLAEWLVRGLIDFDYLSESQLPELCHETGVPLKVGCATYEVLIVCDCVTLRPSTLTMLEEYKQKGGKIIFMGRMPQMSNGVASERAVQVTQGAVCLPYSKVSLLEELENYRDVEIRDDKGAIVNNLMYTMREDHVRKWLFIAHADKSELKQLVTRQNLAIKVKGAYKATLYDTLTGEIDAVDYRAGMEETQISVTLYDSDTVLLALDPIESDTELFTENGTEAGLDSEILTEGGKTTHAIEMDTPCCVDYSLSEPNVLLLDMPEYRVNGGDWNKEEEILRIDKAIRNQLGLEKRGAKKVVQPYIIKDYPEEHILELRYTIVSEAEFDYVSLAMENPENCEITFNEEKISSKPVDYFVDKDIKVVALGRVKRGENVLHIKKKFGQRTDLEACYLLGEFGTKYFGRKAFLCSMPKQLYFGSVVHQGLAFYGGNITYHTEVELEEQSDLEIEMTHYVGALVKVTLDGALTKYLVFSPYKVRFENVKEGKHSIRYELFGTRYNTFSALHTLLADKERVYIGSDYWRSEDDGWAYEYQTRPFGILKAPIIRKLK